MPAFRHHDLTLLNPAFEPDGTTPAPNFFQLKHIVDMLENVGSARIEGNHATLADYVESRLEAQSATLSDQLREMANIRGCHGLYRRACRAGSRCYRGPYPATGTGPQERLAALSATTSQQGRNAFVESGYTAVHGRASEATGIGDPHKQPEAKEFARER